MKLAPILLLISFVGCTGDAFSTQALSVSPDASAFGDAQQDGAPPGRDDGRAEVGVMPDSAASSEAEAASRDVLADPWPDDVIVEPACVWGSAVGCPCTNCFLFDRPDGTTSHYQCCDGSGNPPDSSTDHLCNQGDFPSPHKAYCPSCSCQ